MFTQTHGTWGERLRTFSWDGGIVTLLFLKPHQRCSYHSHRSTYNRFVVIKGKLGVKTGKGYETVLHPKQVFEVEPGIDHEFRTYDISTIVEEIAYVKYDEQDIKRLTLGGPFNDDQKD